MTASYDEQGNYIYPEGFDPETGEWLEGFDEQRAAWEEQYAKAHARWEAHVKQQAEAAKAEVEAGEATSYSSDSPAQPARAASRPRPAARWPPTRRCRRCARSSPAVSDLTTSLAREAQGNDEGPDTEQVSGPSCVVGSGEPRAGVEGVGDVAARGGARAVGTAVAVVVDEGPPGDADQRDDGGQSEDQDHGGHGSNHALQVRSCHEWQE